MTYRAGQRRIKHNSVFVFLFLSAFLLSHFFLVADIYASGVAQVKIDMAIGPIAVKVISESIERAITEERELLIIELNTPGGLATSMRLICQDLLNAEIPVCVYVAPSGARAASAGLFIAYSAHIAAMAPGTNIGAAHVVNMGGGGGGAGQMDSVMSEKVQNDAVAYITSIAKQRNRNIEWAKRAVLESVSIDAQAALDSNIIDILASDIKDLLMQINGFEITLGDASVVLDVSDDDVEQYPLRFKDRFLKVITDPTIAFILFNLGWLGLMIELYNPGAVLPGIVGVICIILAFFAFQQLPINYAGLALIIFAVVLFVLEIKVVSHGVLAVGGVVSMFLGSVMLIDSPAPYLQISMTVIITTVLLISAFFLFVLYFALKAHKSKVKTGAEGLIGAVGEVRSDGNVFVSGELWKADNVSELDVGVQVKIVAIENMCLKVEPR